ncbi:DgyrCDS9967 [Dimorphilus gyrociliatus]|uniref:DgyrCDS9967 n=1 Tax=Dimorphilus gyrociliatus TaxID=2664684 RepID=A0A7I8W1D6_9ANNE|nr:DgyrCDS9967 [Dimorphilus gyrociliatus]
MNNRRPTNAKVNRRSRSHEENNSEHNSSTSTRNKDTIRGRSVDTLSTAIDEIRCCSNIFPFNRLIVRKRKRKSDKKRRRKRVKGKGASSSKTKNLRDVSTSFDKIKTTVLHYQDKVEKLNSELELRKEIEKLNNSKINNDVFKLTEENVQLRQMLKDVIFQMKEDGNCNYSLDASPLRISNKQSSDIITPIIDYNPVLGSSEDNNQKDELIRKNEIEGKGENFKILPENEMNSDSHIIRKCEIDEHESQLHLQEKTIDVLRQRNEELCQKCLLLQNEKYTLKNQIDCFEIMRNSELSEGLKATIGMEKMYDKIKKDKQRLIDEISQLNDHINSLEEKLTNSELKYQRVNGELKICENNVRKYQESNASYELIAQKEKCKNVELLSENEQLKCEISNFQENNENINKQWEMKENSLRKQLKDLNESYEKRILSLNDENEYFRDRLDKTVKEGNKLRDELSNVTKDKLDLVDQVFYLKNYLDNRKFREFNKEMIEIDKIKVSTEKQKKKKERRRHSINCILSYERDMENDNVDKSLSKIQSQLLKSLESSKEEMNKLTNCTHIKDQLQSLSESDCYCEDFDVLRLKIKRQNEAIVKLTTLLEERDKLLEEVQYHQDLTEKELREKEDTIRKMTDENVTIVNNNRLNLNKLSMETNEESCCRSSRIDESLQATTTIRDLTNRNEQVVFQLSDYEDDKRLSSIKDSHNLEKGSIIEVIKEFVDKRISETFDYFHRIINDNEFNVNLQTIKCKTVADGKEEIETWFKRVGSDFKQLKNVANKLKEALQTSSSREEKLNGNVVDLRTKLNFQTNQINEYEKLIRKKEQSISNLSQAVQDCQQSLNEQINDNPSKMEDKTHKEVSVLKETLAEKVDIIKGLEERINTMKEDMTNIFNDKEENRRKIVKQDMKISKLTQMNNSLKENLKVLFKQYKIDGKEDICKNEVEQLRMDCDDKCKEIEQLKITIAENRINELKNLSLSSKDDNEDYKKEINNLQDELKALKQENEFLDTVARNLRDRLDSAQNSLLTNNPMNVNKLLDQVTESRLKIANLEAKSLADKNSIEQYKKLINRLQMELLNGKTRRNERNIEESPETDVNERLVLERLEDKLKMCREEKENFHLKYKSIKLKYEENLKILQLKLKETEKRLALILHSSERLKKKDECSRMRLEKRKKQVEFLKMKYCEMKQNVTILEKEMECLRYDNTKLKIEIAEMKGQIPLEEIHPRKSNINLDNVAFLIYSH